MTAPVLGYADRDSARPGDIIALHLHAEPPGDVTVDLVRMPGDGPTGAPPVTVSASPQPMPLGSWIEADGPIPLGAEWRACVTFLATLPGRDRVLLHLSDGDVRVELLLDPVGNPAAVLTVLGEEHRMVLPGPLDAQTWQTVALDVAEGRTRLSAHGRFVDGPVPDLTTATRVMIGAGQGPNGTDRHFDGKIERPVLASRTETLADWDFSKGIATDAVADVSGNGHHGRCRNGPMRGVQSSGWKDSTDWRAAPDQFAAIHLHSDDTGPFGWPVAARMTLPRDLPSGSYALRLRGQGSTFHIPLTVRPPVNHRPDVAVLIPTATYAAYANRRFRVPAVEPWWCAVTVISALEQACSGLPGLGQSLYDTHADGSERHLSSLRRPVINLQPDGVVWNHQLDLMLADWLARVCPEAGFLTDQDFDREGAAALEGVRVLITGSHPEYITPTERAAIAGFLGSGGRLMYLGGNGFDSSVSFAPDAEGHVELRRRNPMFGTFGAGEQRDLQGNRVGFWAAQGLSGHELVGVAYQTEGFERNSAYCKIAAAGDPRAAWIFNGVPDPIFGAHGNLGGAAGLEIDATDMALGTPAHALILARSEGHAPSYHRSLDNPLRQPGAEMVFFETAAGGAVFSVGSVAWAGALPTAASDNDVARITANVLQRFRDPRPFAPQDQTGTDSPRL